MLLAALGADGGRRARDVIERVSDSSGPPRAVINHLSGAVASWGPHAAVNKRWIAEGCGDFGADGFSPSTLKQVRGDFALFGLEQGAVLLATGCAGGYRPVYVASPSRELVVACTHLAPLLALLPQRPAIDVEYLSASILRRAPKLPESTLYVGINRLPMGESWLVQPGIQPQRRSTVVPLMERELVDDGDLAVRLRFAIAEATRRSARNASRLAVEVSGGLDSSMLLSLLVSLARTGELSAPPEAITYESVIPTAHDDGPHLRSLEDHIEVRAHRVMPKDAAAMVSQLMVVDAMPARSPTLSAAKAIGTVARSCGVDVVLTGDGGDEILDGHPRLFGELARRGQILRAIDGAFRTRGAYFQDHVQRVAGFLLTMLDPLLPTSGLLALRRWRQRPPRWTGAALARHAHLLIAPPEPQATLCETPGERYARLLRWNAFGPWSIVRLQEELVGGYTLRSPLLDDEFLRFAATLPPLSLMQGGFRRGLMREAMRGLVPEDLRLRETKGTSYFFIEQTLALAGGLDALIGLADVRMLADLGLVEPRPFREFFESFRGTSEDDANYADLWLILSAEAFLRQHAGESLLRSQ
jgi:asparagine synthase (glutamine-hydrolysing)